MLNQEIIIHGTTSNGKVFRPSDWADRLCGILSSFNKEEQTYQEWVHPVVIDDIRCIKISPELEERNTAMFRFLMDFAADNDLRMMNYPQQEEAEETTDSVDNSAEEADEEETENAGGLREIMPNETASAFAALSVLRPTLNDINRFVTQVNTIQRAQGYRLLGVFEAGKTGAVAVCGFREVTDLLSGRHFRIDDLVVIPQYRQRGYAVQLLSEVRRIAQENGISQIHVDSHVGAERTIAHRVYFRFGFAIQSYHFVCNID
ncbi:GNAT family N-acetyltransferase [Kingella negevensis]|uniref:Acetyltransferase (GNAT) family protein n=1 Tax=Kingella negevensis TaxID=1522312 RepID=A0A238TAR1_9NEIS|nr:GNAT family N-acetyltransferase [Kingella negevensis]MDK4679379.1 GNAT family N-acetyltransferase [Kingella negevensis]MDK4682901.1 GNAT family N-acetyltransferase [Kingella negevensis]MDK4685482.1 GNAT family N-acetyltransferase [Kingella negevensis]MDK4689563.1 GNAT family N-acetyltransferase [Kingella negevensis]MDK4691100.1 GNAT family N-acetyltransferase [Kingella negevensis]